MWPVRISLLVINTLNKSEFAIFVSLMQSLLPKQNFQKLISQICQHFLLKKNVRSFCIAGGGGGGGPSPQLILIGQGPVVQSIVSLMNSLSSQFVKCFTTL